MAMTKRTTAAMIKKLERAKATLAKDRDALRDLFDELETLKEDCEEAYDSLENAIDALSRLV